MEVSLTPGKAAIVINVITVILALIATATFMKTLNAYGRWRLYHHGKVNMNMHFQYMSFFAALGNTFRHSRGSRTVFLFFFLQAAILLALLVLKTLAPIGISESKSVHVNRNHTLAGQSLCRQHKPSSVVTMIALASEKVITHFSAGGGVIRVGRTARNRDALILEDTNGSHGELKVVSERNVSSSITLAYRMRETHLNLSFLIFENGSNFSPRDTLFGYNFKDRHYPTTTSQVTEGPIYVVATLTKPFSGPELPDFWPERYAFCKCDAPRLELSHGESKKFDTRCDITIFERNITESLILETIPRETNALKFMDEAFMGESMTTLGQRSMMVLDTASSLAGEPCDDTYVAYLPKSEVSTASIALIVALGAFALLFSISAFASILVTRGTLDWNGSYHNFIALIANSDSIGLPRWNDTDGLLHSCVVVERSKCDKGSSTYQIHVASAESEPSAVPKASLKLIQ